MIDGTSCSSWFPRRIIVSCAGNEYANGIYSFAGEISNRPYFQKDGGRECLWYFNECPLSRSTSGSISYNGWYLSNRLGTSSYHSTEDMYSSYFADCVPKLSLELIGTVSEDVLQSLSDFNASVERPWVIRSPGLPPLSGCGLPPIPSIRYLVSEYFPDQLVMLLRLCLPNGQTKSLHISENDTALSVRIMCEKILQVPYYQIRLLLRGCSLSRLDRLEIQPDDTDMRKIINTGIKMGDIVTVELIPPAFSFQPLSCPKVCIVGAGPVGLWIAIQLKILRSDWLITCCEKRSKYERSHALAISPKAFEGMVEWCPGRPAAAELRLLKDRWMPRTRTSTVEGDLQSLASNLGINILYNSEVLSLHELTSEGNYDLVVCCDGAKSHCRSQLVSETMPHHQSEYREQKQLGSLLQVKFEAYGEVSISKGHLSQFLQNLPASHEFFNILPGNFDADKCTTPMTVFALMTSEVDETLQISEPIESNTSNLIYSDLLAVLSDICCGGIVEGTMKISILPVSYSIAQVVGGKVHDKYIFLAGDAAMGLPLEKGLNYGWRIASRLCHYLAYSSSYESSLLAYNSYFQHESNIAIEVVEQQYSHYVQTIHTASSFRNFLRPFALYLQTNSKTTSTSTGGSSSSSSSG